MTTWIGGEMKTDYTLQTALMLATNVAMDKLAGEQDYKRRSLLLDTVRVIGQLREEWETLGGADRPVKHG